jgi:hypothetical protein
MKDHTKTAKQIFEGLACLFGEEDLPKPVTVSCVAGRFYAKRINSPMLRREEKRLKRLGWYQVGYCDSWVHDTLGY